MHKKLNPIGAFPVFPSCFFKLHGFSWKSIYVPYSKRYMSILLLIDTGLDHPLHTNPGVDKFSGYLEAI
jgi:hypothetical protein